MSENGKKPKTIAITGASSGIGAALAVRYASRGVFLALMGRDSGRLEGVAAQCREKGADVDVAIVDVRDCNAMQNWADRIRTLHAFDLVIANAGISGGTGSQSNGETYTQAQEIFDINVNGVLNTINAVLPDMIKQKSGQIALMSSLAGFQGWAGAPAYSASKGWVRLYGEALHGSVKKSGVRVNVICPGFIRTPLTDVNPYKMPFMMEPEKAADVIIKGLERNKVRIAFPWQTYLLVGFLGALPGWLGSVVVQKMPTKPLSK